MFWPNPKGETENSGAADYWGWPGQTLIAQVTRAHYRSRKMFRGYGT
jgi:hypothetical protein